MSDRWTACKLWCLDQVLVDRGATDFDFRVAYFIGHRMDRASGEARVRQEDIAKAVGAKQRRSVQRSIERLCGLGHLEVKQVTGRSNVNGYRLPLEKASFKTPFDDQNVSAETPFGGIKGVPNNDKRRPKQQEKASRHSHTPFLLPLNLPTPRGAALADVLAPLGEKLAARIGADKAQSWFNRSEVVDLVDGVLTITAPTKFMRDYIIAHFDPVLIEVSAKLAPVTRVEIVIASQGAAA
ncbi:hypothetical protein CK489_28820 [Bradyrhizobium sp. UFLA03-84]|uniref:DnaA N-terminal domain-containing protein n=1 Tax=Bradyrhizobium sp. UFLA03-84 TaxID=418599 RepID=UPI000BAE2DC2|nr:DnaA N-terminal domain-containing protein [Bradyrhizobium sp. UFLA03-84]PAY05396.1 hypothetical protein CK489_28820 [Bradyrhizobium sp. UFLA03-84]